MVRILGLVGEKEDAQNILNGTWLPPTHLYKYTKDILLSTKKTLTINDLRDIKVNIAMEFFYLVG